MATRLASFEELNAHLEQCCLARLDHQLRGHTETIGGRLERDLAALQPRPWFPYEACDQRMMWVSALSLVRYDRNDDSVPTAYGHRAVLVKGYVDKVVISCGAEVIARHARSYGREDFVFEADRGRSARPSAWPGRRRNRGHAKNSSVQLSAVIR